MLVLSPSSEGNGCGSWSADGAGEGVGAVGRDSPSFLFLTGVSLAAVLDRDFSGVLMSSTVLVLRSGTLPDLVRDDSIDGASVATFSVSLEVVPNLKMLAASSS